MKGFEGWFEIFKGGRRVDGHGRAHDGDRLIDEALSRFNPAEAPRPGADTAPPATC